MKRLALGLLIAVSASSVNAAVTAPTATTTVAKAKAGKMASFKAWVKNNPAKFAMLSAVAVAVVADLGYSVQHRTEILHPAVPAVAPVAAVPAGVDANGVATPAVPAVIGSLGVPAVTQELDYMHALKYNALDNRAAKWATQDKKHMAGTAVAVIAIVVALWDLCDRGNNSAIKALYNKIVGKTASAAVAPVAAN